MTYVQLRETAARPLSHRQATSLVGAGTRSVVSTARGSAADVRLLGGQVRVAVADAPTLTARASGDPGGAQVRWAAPVVTVGVGGQERTLPADGSPIDFTSPDNPLLHVELSLGQPTDVVESANGTRASANASLLHVEVGLSEVTLLEANLFPLKAAATAPAGGVTCDAGSAGTDPNDAGDPGDSGSPGPGTPTPGDLDGDGLGNDEESDAGTNPVVADTDGDGLTDGREVDETETDPNDADTDGDRLTDGREVTKTRTNPKRKDTDRDGLTDGREVLRHAPGYRSCFSNPKRADTDRDRLKDGREVKHVRTNPCDWDTDDGGKSDGEEVRRGSDPLDRRSSPSNPRVARTAATSWW